METSLEVIKTRNDVRQLKAVHPEIAIR